jgi:hypothetical protein
MDPPDLEPAAAGSKPPVAAAGEGSGLRTDTPAADCPDSMSRLWRFRSARISEAT